MKCGEKGFTTKAGLPCQQNLPIGKGACIWHGSTPEERRVLAMKGGIASRMLSGITGVYEMAPFTSRESVVQFSQDLARRVLTENLDPRRVDTALRAAGVALTAYAQQTQEKLVDALLKIEHGGAAMLLLARLQEGIGEGKRRPLPSLPVREVAQVVEKEFRG